MARSRTCTLRRFQRTSWRIFAVATYPLETKRLMIRPVQDSDAEATAALVTQPISRWTATWPPSISAEGVLDRIKSATEAQRSDQSRSPAILRNTDGALMGWASLHRNRQAPKTGSLAYWP